jgi:DNA polymerase-3 subunit gamma/tau
MGYVVLARKYRPRNFSQMAGQEHVVRALTNALDQRRLHHAYLFTGTRGIGKTTISRILAKSLNCTGVDGRGEVTSSPCGQCPACRDIDADRYVDYIELDAASNRSIDEIRDLIERAAYKPAVGRYKVFMIDEAHQLTKDAFNALLKTLEEPPEYLKFVLATTDPERMLPTVLSRCLQFNLRPMAPEVVREHLALVLDLESIPAETGALRLLSEAARGSMRDALSLTDQAIAYGGGQLTEAGVSAMLGATHTGACLEVLQALGRGDAAGVLQAADVLRQSGASASGALDDMAKMLQRAAVEQAVPGALEDDSPDPAGLAALGSAFTPEELQLTYSIVVHGKADLALMTDEHAALVMVLLRVLAFQARTAPPAAPRSAPLRAPSPPSRSVPATSARVDVGASASAAEASRADAADTVRAAVTQAWNASPVAASAVAPQIAVAEPEAVEPRQAAMPDKVAEFTDAPAADAVAPLSTGKHVEQANLADLAELANRWDAAVRRLAEEGRLSGLVKELAWQGGLVAWKAGPPTVWRLRIAHESLRGGALKDKLAESLAQSFGVPSQVELEAGEPGDTPSRRDTAERARRQAQAEAVIREDPLVQSLLTQFSTARLVQGSIKPA